MEKNIEVTRTKKTEKKDVAKRIAIGAGIVAGSMIVGGVVTYLVIFDQTKSFCHVANLPKEFVDSIRNNEAVDHITVTTGKLREIFKNPLNIFKHDIKSVSYVKYFDAAGNDITSAIK